MRSISAAWHPSACSWWSPGAGSCGSPPGPRHHDVAFDLGIYDKGNWLLSEGERPFVTVRGLDLFGHHTNLILYLWAPFYRFLGAGAEFLVVSEMVLVGLAVIPVYLLARDRLRSVGDDRAGLLAVGLAAVFLLNPSVQNQLWWMFHPDTLSILPVLCTWLYATRRRWSCRGVGDPRPALQRGRGPDPSPWLWCSPGGRSSGSSWRRARSPAAGSC
ncbi:MAG: DUF2079 domain-containing protein [Acidimicrobiia bacterium]|nr:DUF2079 domain-containing protein [Acidimicrobiia bacterium]